MEFAVVHEKKLLFTNKTVMNINWFSFSIKFYHKPVSLEKSEKVNGRHIICLEMTRIGGSFMLKFVKGGYTGLS